MALLPFLFKAEEFYPLQPENAETELSLRTNPSYAPHYRNIAEEHYADLPAYKKAHAEPTVVNAYQDWKDLCRRMDEETQLAKKEWKDFCTNMEKQIADLKREKEELYITYKELQRREKPPQPRSSRK